jgi:hypothetical protein
VRTVQDAKTNKRARQNASEMTMQMLRVTPFLVFAIVSLLAFAATPRGVWLLIAEVAEGLGGRPE